MTIDAFNKQLEKRIGKSSILDIDSIGDFQCDQTHGFPTFFEYSLEFGDNLAFIKLQTR